MDDVEIRRLIGQARVARLATIGAGGRAHIVPICLAIDGDDIYFAVDHKPKRTTDLQRLRNIESNPHVAVLVDHYEEDWTRVWWARVDGTAHVLAPGDATARAVDLLVSRYAQYAAQRPQGPAVAIRIERLSGWSAAR